MDDPTHYAPSGLHFSSSLKPRALPWAIASSRVAARSFITRKESHSVFRSIAATFPVLTKNHATAQDIAHISSALKEQNAIAQGNALGCMMNIDLSPEGAKLLCTVLAQDTAPSGLHCLWNFLPRALPWAIACSRVAAKSFITRKESHSVFRSIAATFPVLTKNHATAQDIAHISSALKEHNAIAQGNALGMLGNIYSALKGRNAGGTSPNRISNSNP